MISDIVEAAIGVAKALQKVAAFYSECQQLLLEASLIESILTTNAAGFGGDPAIAKLSNLLRECCNYLNDCRQSATIIRNPVSEGLILKKIPKYEKQLKVWIGIANLSATVAP